MRVAFYQMGKSKSVDIVKNIIEVCCWVDECLLQIDIVATTGELNVII